MLRSSLFVLPVVLLPSLAPAATLTETKITASDAAIFDYFGSSVAIHGNTAVVGANGRGNSSASPSIGSAYLFDTTTGNQIAKLTASDAEAGDFFGSSVAISGNTAIIGTQYNKDESRSSGSAYLFDTTTGNQIAKLTASDAASGDSFGSVAISGNTAIIGAQYNDDAGRSSGSAYLFDTKTGIQIAKLTASDAEAGDFFGSSVAISGNTAIVGADGTDDAGGNSGSAYLFDTTTGTQIAKLTAGDAEAGDSFGRSVAISGNIAIVGAFGDDDAGRYSGSAYLFDTTTGNQIAKLTASDAEAYDYFGLSVAISGNTAIVGAQYNDDAGFSSGSAYLFDTTTGNQIAKLTAGDATTGDWFGGSVAISGSTAIVGALGNGDAGFRSGSAYLYASAPTLAPVPLPAGAWLLITALGLLGLGQWRRA